MLNREALSDLIASRVRDLRERAGLSRDQLADAARIQGAAPDFTHQSLAFLENGRPRGGVRTRLFVLDEVFALAAALEVSPLELLGDAAPLFVGDTTTVSVVCPKCTAGVGEMQRATREDLSQLGALLPLESTLAETAYRLATAIDGSDARALPGLTKELRATVQELSAGRRRSMSGPEDEFDDLDDPE